MVDDALFNCLLFGNKKDYEKLDDMKKVKYQLFVVFMSILNSQFEWKGLPKEIKPYNLEKILNFYGQAVLFKYNGDFLVTSCANTSLLNIYGEPTQVQPVALNGLTFPVVNVSNSLSQEGAKFKDGVRIRNNLYCTPTYFLIKPFIDKLCFIWESMGINAGLSRLKYIIHANKNLASTIKTEIKKIVGGADCLPVVNEKVNIMSEIEKLDFNIPYESEKYWEDFDKTFAFICEICGITTNLSQNKKERLIVSEVESNDELTTLCEDARLEFRKYACEEINELFGLDISVDNKVQDVKATQPTDNVNLNQDNDN